ncbi:MAG: thymidylate synthase [Bacilli bacterium]|nr:thymidylate synthase [Bacilli bacterium]
MEIDYSPYIERTPDGQYKNLIREILEKGTINPSRMTDKNGNNINTIELLGANPIRFNILENGAPFITERSIESFWESPIGELFGFINGARTQEELEAFGCKWWKYWVTEKKCEKRGLETGDLGPGSYGAAFANFPTADGGSFNQFAEIIKQMKENPELKTHIITPFIPQYTIRNTDHQQKVVVVPCHGLIHFQIIQNRLSMLMFQRSCDVLIGCASNWAQYTALLLAMAEVLDLIPHEFIHSISNAHIYENQLPWVDEILSRESKPFPTLKLVKKHKNIFDYRSSDFELSDYKAGDPIKDIPVGV